MLDELERLSELLFSRLVAHGVVSGAAVAEVSTLVEMGPKRTLRGAADATYLDMAGLSTRWSRPDFWVRRPVGSGARFTNGDALMARITPCLENGKTAFVDFLADGEVAYGSTEFIVLRSRAGVPPEFAYCLTRYGPFRDHAVANMNGTSGRQRVSGEALGRFELPELDQTNLDAFGESARPVFALVRSLSEQTVALSGLRDRLLPGLLSGKLSWQATTPLAMTDVAS
jgi:type I restriction enzyme S subunit